MELSDLRTADEVRAERLEADVQFRVEWDKTAFAREVGVAVVKYRTEHGLSQRDLAGLTGLHQPAIARLESGGEAPALATLAKLTRATGLTFRVDIANGGAVLVAV
ncbi:helix-turn-helix domain-containing protein [Actinoplanes derwentensis]|uniref:Helix-turn-helix n=1 Tax=Actinoplanes derwentensis TaxID=113562 RepID=A0A1H1ZEN6_9ACTN|nr:helix-turn-helix transcriptional regulator [Actinoplanes derwentensis]GID82395.1 hypothetical protein Ade03nite_13190 [Actinoplanes derwentensis]SDT32017.1 Helix-turn-helix [Actinoplanes derwentensis]